MTVSETTIRELDGHDLADDDSCDVSGCDGHAAYAITGSTISGWLCERHSEQADSITECVTCGSLTIGPCKDDLG